MTIQLTAGQFSILGSVRDGNTPILWTPELIHFEEDVRALCSTGYLTRQDERLALTAPGRAVLAERIEVRSRGAGASGAPVALADAAASAVERGSRAA